MEKSPEAFRTISEVADWLGIQAHVLRFWESKFTQVKPVKRAGGRRYYRPADMLLLGGIKKLLHEDGMTIKGVQKVLREQGVATVSELSQALDDIAVSGERPRRAQSVVPFQNRPSLLDSATPTDRETEQIDMALDGQTAAPPESESAPEAVPETSSETTTTDAQDDAPARPAPVPSFRRHTTKRDDPADLDAPALPDAAVEDPTPAPPPVAEDDVVPPTEAEPVSADAELDAAEPVESILKAPIEETRPPEPAPVPRPRIVDAPDPPDESDIAVDPGVLGLAAALKRVPDAARPELAALTEALDQWHKSQTARHKAQ
ncbi:MAG: MerR family transcriptional regulator [Pseudomonadota bacterium]